MRASATQMELFLRYHDYKYAVEQSLLTLFPAERPVYPEAPSGGEKAAVVSLHRGKTYVTAGTVLTVPGGGRYTGRARFRAAEAAGPVECARLEQRAVKRSFYRAAVAFLGKKPEWGSLSGIRPAKLMRGLLAEGLSETAAARRFMALYDVSPARAELCLSAAKAAAAADALLDARDICLYVGVPFCPTRCAYCSFVSQSVERSGALTGPYVDALEKDVRATAAAVGAAGLRPVSLYIGGGTPTALSALELDRLLSVLGREFDLSACREITVEAGRPDTITAEKLAVLKDRGATRISVNPQTMSDRVLAAIGRRHTAADTLEALSLARALGGFLVNMDLIAGLPEDTVEGFCGSVDAVIALSPENITVHTLALKKGSRITLEGTALPPAEAVEAMLALSRARLYAAGYAPYYLYRQKFMSGGFENLGWSRPGTENLYNICVMEELRSVVAMGAGASTKLTRGDGRLKRRFAPKYPAEYIGRIAEVCADKNMIGAFYHELVPDGDQL